ncbi:MAG: glutamate synthase, partial [Clostridiaceae bacterium]|nr:glutamate synthase [Clostridiaceae bacterium]
MKLNASNVSFKDLNYSIKASRDKEIIVDNVLGQRYIGSGQDATGDTMDSGSIIVYGNCGDTTGYAMRGGEIYIKGNAGYRVGIHMKEYADKIPVIVVGGKVGDFLGEYQAGGIIVVLGIGVEGIPVGAFCGTGMHGGKIYIRSSQIPVGLPKQVVAEKLENKK